MEGLQGTIAELARIRPTEFAADEVLQPYSGRDRFRGPRDRAELRTIAGIAGGLTLLVLLVACANLSNLVLSRVISRFREFSLCAALGATRWRIFRQQLIESALFAGIAAGAGLLVGHWVARLAAAQISLPSYIDITPDWRVVVVTCAVAFLVTLTVGAVPAWIVSRRDLVTAMRGRPSNIKRHRPRSVQVLLDWITGRGLLCPADNRRNDYARSAECFWGRSDTSSTKSPSWTRRCLGTGSTMRGRGRSGTRPNVLSRQRHTWSSLR